MSPKTSRIGTNPLRASASTAMIPTAEPATQPAPAPQPAAKPAPKAPNRGRLGIYLDEEMVDYLRDVADFIGRRTTLGQIIADALPAHLAELEARYNNGQKFPPRPPERHKLVVGPPFTTRPPA